MHRGSVALVVLLFSAATVAVTPPPLFPDPVASNVEHGISIGGGEWAVVGSSREAGSAAGVLEFWGVGVLNSAGQVVRHIHLRPSFFSFTQAKYVVRNGATLLVAGRTGDGGGLVVKLASASLNTTAMHSVADTTHQHMIVHRSKVYVCGSRRSFAAKVMRLDLPNLVEDPSFPAQESRPPTSSRASYYRSLLFVDRGWWLVTGTLAFGAQLEYRPWIQRLSLNHGTVLDANDDFHVVLGLPGNASHVSMTGLTRHPNPALTTVWVSGGSDSTAFLAQLSADCLTTLDWVVREPQPGSKAAFSEAVFTPDGFLYVIAYSSSVERFLQRRLPATGAVDNSWSPVALTATSQASPFASLALDSQGNAASISTTGLSPIARSLLNTHACFLGPGCVCVAEHCMFTGNVEISTPTTLGTLQVQVFGNVTISAPLGVSPGGLIMASGVITVAPTAALQVQVLGSTIVASTTILVLQSDGGGGGSTMTFPQLTTNDTCVAVEQEPSESSLSLVLSPSCASRSLSSAVLIAIITGSALVLAAVVAAVGVTAFNVRKKRRLQNIQDKLKNAGLAEM